MKRSAKRGFTMIELMVVIGLSVSTLSVAAPAIQRAREAARRTQCRNNLKQLGLALHNYHDAYNCFPPGWVSKNAGPQAGPSYSWQVSVLPYSDHATQYNQIDFNKPPRPATDPLMQRSFPVYRCPSDSTPETNPLRGGYGSSNYSGVYGSGALPLWSQVRGADLWPGGVEIEMRSNGTFTRNSRVGMRDIKDGTSNTIVVGERCITSGAAIWTGVMGNQNADDAVTDGSHASPLNKSVSGFSSRHEGGANFLLGDGAVRFLSDSIDSKPGADFEQGKGMGLFQKLMNKADRQVVGDF